ncbi:MAG: LysR family transcriptional regulator [Alphaproteobacteria bacterium]|nr:LysR family transcriptional regulator [Alphaproteobacteria bacterium]
MNKTNINAVDLNLLRVFDALMEEGNVTRAGGRLGLSQSAVSHSLNRLRELMGDELFVRSAHGVRPTARANEMAPGVHAAMQQLHGAITQRPFTPTSTTRTFTIIAGAYASAVLLPPLVARMSAEAPGASLVIAEAATDMLDQLDSHRADFALSAIEAAPERISVETLIEETLVWVVRAGHPLSQGRLTLERLVDIPHVAIRRRRPDLAGRESTDLIMRSTWEDQGLLDAELRAHNLTRRVVVTVPDTYSALAIIRRSDMAAQIPMRLATLAAQGGFLTMLKPPYRPADVHLSVLALRERLADAGLAWMHALLKSVAGDL